MSDGDPWAWPEWVTETGYIEFVSIGIPPGSTGRSYDVSPDEPPRD